VEKEEIKRKDCEEGRNKKEWREEEIKRKECREGREK
jgi:hypothetical protein